MPKITSYLEFGKLEKNKKIVYDSRYGQEAYDFIMIPRYLRDIRCYHIGEANNTYHKEDLMDNIKKYVALSICKHDNEQTIYYEIGSSLMGVIDAMEFLNETHKKLDINNILFLGVDNSKLMNFCAMMLHKNQNIYVMKKIKQIVCDLFFAKGVSLLYAFNDEKSLCDILSLAKIAVFDYTFSKDTKIIDYVGTGKKVTFLSLERCRQLLKHDNKRLILRKSERINQKDNMKVSYECVYGDKNIVQDYLTELNNYLI